MKIGRRGNVLWVRIPAAIVREMKLKPGEAFEVIAVGEHSFEVRRVPEPVDTTDETDM